MSSWGNETTQAAIALPEPSATEISEPHWQACKEQKLLVQQCTRCQSYTFPPEKNCPQCFENSLAWQQSSGKGKIYSFTVVYRPQTPAFKTPYIAAIIELDEGWYMLSNIIDCDIDKLTINQAVAVCFEKRGKSVLPMFRTV
jgi:uncharacterized OB-fold protein